VTTGSWTVGTSSSESTLFAAKSWNGTDGKYETWAGGSRAKWNQYQLSHTRWTQSDPGGFGYASDFPQFTLSQCKSTVGWGTSDDLRVLQKLSEEIKGHAFDLGINLAEGARTYGLILNNLRSIGGALRELKRGNIADAVRFLGVPRPRHRRLRAQDLSGRWLELQYGWRPLVDQSYEYAKALEAATQARPIHFTASSKRTVGYNASSSIGFYDLWVSVSVTRKITCDLYEDITFARSMGLTNPASIVWEIVPYSFVVDWFLPVGNWLSVLGVIPSLVGRFLTTDKGSVKGTRFVKTSPFPLGRKDTGLRAQHTVINRVPSSVLSVPRPTFKPLPRALSPKHLANAVALIHQSLSGNSPSQGY
jgi:hypothetical protein